MASIGPALPPHLAKRKRSDEDIGSSKDSKRPKSPKPSPKSTEMRPQSIGPAAPSHKKPTVGPALPPSARSCSDSSSDDDDIGPSLPGAETKPTRRILGPAPPPAPLSERPPASPDHSSDSDSDFGPAPPPAGGTRGVSAFDRDPSRFAAAAGEDEAKPQRADWMLAPPSGSDWGSRVDPTKLKNRKFKTGGGLKGAATREPGEEGMGAKWTETAEEKRRRIEEEVLGTGGGTSKEKAADQAAAGGGRERQKDDDDMDRRVQEYNRKHRPEALTKSHQRSGKGKEEEDDPSKRAFDREKDIGGGSISYTQRRDLMAKARDFGSRFEKGKYL